LFSIKNLVNKATEYKKGSTTKEEVEKKLDELSLTDTQKKEMLILFEHYARSQRYIEAEPEAVVSNETSPTASFSLTRPRDVDDDPPPQSHPTYREGAHDLVEATDLRKAKGKAKIDQLLRLNTEHSAFVADGHGRLTTKARNTRDTVLYPFMHCYATHYQSDADLFLEAFGQNWSHSKFAARCRMTCDNGIDAVAGEGVGASDDAVAGEVVGGGDE
jgi:hypothetical protein